MIGVFHDAAYYVALVIVFVCLGVAALKIVWNLGLPYAMLLEERRGWSVFPLIEVVPIVLAGCVSWLAGFDGVFATSRILAYGLVSVALSYLHFCIVLFIGGLCIWARKK